MTNYRSTLKRIGFRLLGYRVEASLYKDPWTSAAPIVRKLAQEFDVEAELMSAFVRRFAPAAVPQNYFRSEADTLLFVHIPKTAGISVGKALQQSFDRFYSVEWNNIAPSFEHLARTAAACQQSGNSIRQVIMGHFGWPQIQLWKGWGLPIKAGTIFRDPVRRVVSNYMYNCSEIHPDHQSFAARYPDIEKYIKSLNSDVQLTQAIGHASSFEGALIKLINCYTFIGVTENLGSSLVHLSSSHGLTSACEYRVNVGRAFESELSIDMKELILSRSRNDKKIHALMKRVYDDIS